MENAFAGKYHGKCMGLMSFLECVSAQDVVK